jgi:hypothetical protein
MTFSKRPVDDILEAVRKMDFESNGCCLSVWERVPVRYPGERGAEINRFLLNDGEGLKQFNVFEDEEERKLKRKDYAIVLDSRTEGRSFEFSQADLYISLSFCLTVLVETNDVLI